MLGDEPAVLRRCAARRRASRARRPRLSVLGTSGRSVALRICGSASRRRSTSVPSSATRLVPISGASAARTLRSSDGCAPTTWTCGWRRSRTGARPRRRPSRQQQRDAGDARTGRRDEARKVRARGRERTCTTGAPRTLFRRPQPLPCRRLTGTVPAKTRARASRSRRAARPRARARRRTARGRGAAPRP